MGKFPFASTQLLIFSSATRSHLFSGLGVKLHNQIEVDTKASSNPLTLKI